MNEKEPYRESIIKVLKEQYKIDKKIFLSARDIHNKLIRMKIDIQLSNMYRALDRLSGYGYVEVNIERNNVDNDKYIRTFRYNP